MGIEVHGFNFLRYATTFGNLNKTLTVGRQGLHVDEHFVRKSLKLREYYTNAEYCEVLLKEHFGASEVDSVDNSDFENASLILDMNYPPPRHVQGQYDTIFDGGCLEHIYNVPVAFRNLSLLCRQGGQIIHVLPANNFCGHGFWQFSPELFFSLYSHTNGYKDTEVFVADSSQLKKWFKVYPPSNGKRVNIRSSSALYVLVRTVLQRSDFSHEHIQQSDYIHQWTSAKQPVLPQKKRSNRTLLKYYLRQIPVYREISLNLRSFYRNRIRFGKSELLNSRNPGLCEIKVSSLLQSDRILIT